MNATPEIIVLACVLLEQTQSMHCAVCYTVMLAIINFY